MMAAKTLSMSVSAFFLLTVILLTLHPYSTSAASSSTSPSSASVSPPAATPVPTIVQSTSSWKYYGCYSETTLTNGTGGVRALNGGSNQDSDTMIVESCLAFCSSGGYGFAGLEYTRECYCAPLLSSLSTHLPDSACNLPCMGNDTQICGGSLKLTVYQSKSAAKGVGAKIGGFPFQDVGSVLALGIAVGGLLCLA